MERKIELPKRADNHIRETSGYKVLDSLIPSEWIIRSITERDYGVDCYIELVDDENSLPGEIAFIQAKATDSINWRKTDNGFKFSKVERTTTNYLNGFKIPTYLFLVDLSEKSMYYLPIKEYIKEHYKEYISGSDTFSYDFHKDKDLFTVDSFKKSFQRNNQYDQFRNELQYFISNMRKYVDFMWEHNDRDCFMQIEQEDMLFFEALHRNVTFLQNYFDTTNRFPSIAELDAKGKARYGEDYELTLFEGVLTDMFNSFKASVLEIVDRIIELITQKEFYYWAVERNYIYNYFSNLDKERLFE